MSLLVARIDRILKVSVSTRPRLGSLLVSAGLLEASQLSRALDAQLQFEGRLGTNLIELGMITEDQLSQTLGQQHGVPWVSCDDLRNLSDELVQRLPQRAARMYRAIPISWDPHRAKTIRVAMTDPGNLRAADELGMLIGARVEPVAAAELRIAALLEQHYGITRPQRFFIRVVSPDAAEAGAEPSTDGQRPATAAVEPQRGPTPRRRNVEVRYLTPPPPPSGSQEALNLTPRPQAVASAGPEEASTAKGAPEDETPQQREDQTAPAE